MSATDMLKDGGYIMVNKEITKKHGINAALMFGELCAEYDYWAQRGMIDDEGWFYSTVENVQNATGLSKYLQKQTLETLKDYIDVRYSGVPRKRYIRLVGENFDCKKSKDLTTRSQNFDHKKSKDLPASGQEICPQEVKEFDLNNNNSNNNINNNNVNKGYAPTPTDTIKTVEDVYRIFGC